MGWLGFRSFGSNTTASFLSGNGWSLTANELRRWPALMRWMAASRASLQGTCSPGPLQGAFSPGAPCDNICRVCRVASGMRMGCQVDKICVWQSCGTRGDGDVRQGVLHVWQPGFAHPHSMNKGTQTKESGQVTGPAKVEDPLLAALAVWRSGDGERAPGKVRALLQVRLVARC